MLDRKQDGQRMKGKDKIKQLCIQYKLRKKEVKSIDRQRESQKRKGKDRKLTDFKKIDGY